MEFEERLLKLNEYYKSLLTLSEVFKLRQYMKQISEITDIYFELINDYKKDDVEEYNIKLLNENIKVDIDFIKINDFINNILEKYSIVL